MSNWKCQSPFILSFVFIEAFKKNKLVIMNITTRIVDPDNPVISTTLGKVTRPFIHQTVKFSHNYHLDLYKMV